jgi:hypothetical protein
MDKTAMFIKIYKNIFNKNYILTLLIIQNLLKVCLTIILFYSLFGAVRLLDRKKKHTFYTNSNHLKHSGNYMYLL